MPHCLFATDLHGRPSRYEALFRAIEERAPAVVFLGGDLTPFPFAVVDPDRPLPIDFVNDYLAAEMRQLRTRMKDRYPEVFLILGNDDIAALEPDFVAGETAGVWTYCHNRRVAFGDYAIYGYACVPPTPFQLKDWERYDISRHIPPGAVSPEEGRRSVEVDPHVIRYATIAQDLAALTGDDDLERAVMLFHGPPYKTALDRVANDGKLIDYVPLDLHVGSIAVRRLIEARQPLVTLHGHIHESARLTGSWRDAIGRTQMFGAAHDEPQLALVSFDLENVEAAVRELI